MNLGGRKKSHTVSQLPHPNKPRHVLVKNLEPATILFRLAGVPKTAGAIEDFGEGVEVDCFFAEISLSNNLAISSSSPFFKNSLLFLKRCFPHTPHTSLSRENRGSFGGWFLWGKKKKPRTVSTNALFQIADLGQRGVLAAGAQEVAEGFEGDAPVAALVEEGKGFFVVG